METIKFDCGCTFQKDGKSIILDIEKAPKDCKRTWDMIGAGLTKGIFQLESRLGHHWAKKLRPENIEHLSALGSLLRPGCLRACDAEGVNMPEHYCRRKNGEEPVEYFHPALEPILKDTYGVSCYQEQSMQISTAIAGFDKQEADELRRAIGKKKADEMAKVKIKFLAGIKKMNIVTEEEGGKIFEWIEQSQRYAFNHSHAACYALDGYWSAYCKAHFPVLFFTKWLYYAEEKQDTLTEIRELINEAKLMNVEVLPPNITNLQPKFDTDGKVVTFGITDIKDIGDAILHKITTCLKDINFKSMSWFRMLVTLTQGGIGVGSIEKMIAVGAFRHYGSNRAAMIQDCKYWGQIGTAKGEVKFIINNIDRYNSLLEALKGVSPLKKEGGGCSSIRRQNVVKSMISLIENPPCVIRDSANWIAGAEESGLGIALTCSRIDGCEPCEVTCTCKDFVEEKPRGCIMLGVEIQEIQELKTKKGKNPGQNMARLTISDGSCAVESVIFPEPYKEYSNLLFKNNTVFIQGEKDRKQGTFIVKKVWQAKPFFEGV